MKKSTKIPVGMPERGDRCRLRGDEAACGVLKTCNDLNWAVVAWDPGVVAPKFVHRFELLRIS